jgi:hypothetical protein
MGKGFWRWYDRAARADFGGNILGLFFDWRKWLWGFVPSGGGMTFLWAAVEGRSPLNVWIVAVVVMAALAVIVYVLIAILEKVASKASFASESVSGAIPADFASEVPDVRVADTATAWELFETTERDVLLPLLESGKIEAWGRLGNGYPPLMKIPPDFWRTNYLVRYLRAGGGGINQTFLKSKGRHESTYYDVYLNRLQLTKVFPALWDAIMADNRGPDRRRSGSYPERISSCYIKALRSSELGSRFSAYSYITFTSSDRAPFDGLGGAHRWSQRALFGYRLSTVERSCDGAWQ